MRTINLFILGLLLAVLMITACMSSTPTVKDESSTNPPTTDTTKETPSAGNGVTGAVVVEDKPIPIFIEPIYHPLIKGLLDKSKAIHNYKYTFKSVSLNKNGILVEDDSYDALIKYNKVKIVHPDQLPLRDDIFYDVAYLNTDTKEAWAVCSVPNVMCRGEWKKAYKIDYNYEKWGPTPLDLIENLDPRATVRGQRLFENRQTTVVESKNADGTIQRLYIDNYYGLPLRQFIFKLSDDNEEITQVEHIFYRLAAGSGTVKNSEVNIPEDFELVK
ncbi:hypothetical protein HZC32_03790 [Candidatus Woesearchaeota archaeon]|nr:hypothetical protein [Candidatus Woesearchaeota archaeon]